MSKFTSGASDHLVLPARVGVTEGRERFLRSQIWPVPTPVSIRLLIDTGAKRTTLIPGLLRHLQLSKASEAHVITPFDTVTADLFWIRLEFLRCRLGPDSGGPGRSFADAGGPKSVPRFAWPRFASPLRVLRIRGPARLLLTPRQSRHAHLAAPPVMID
jgi:hypothetical protein